MIYADESKSGKYFADFYGGALVRGEHVRYVRETLEESKAAHDLGAEVKWSKVSAHYLDRYKGLMDDFFDLVAQDLLKVRVMFTQRRNVPTGLSRVHVEERYHRLYYQFIKHAFGLRYANPDPGNPIRVRLYLDKLPDRDDKNLEFKQYLARLGDTRECRQAGVVVPLEDIAEVRSHNHVILQCADVVLGPMQFRLNDEHKKKPPGSRIRAKKTRAKENLYKHINARIRAIYPGFNIGESTGRPNGHRSRWEHPYRHWKFVPNEHWKDDSRTKP